MAKPGEGVGDVDERSDTDEALLAGAREAEKPAATPSSSDGESDHPPGHQAAGAAAAEPVEGGRPAVRREPKEEG
jgi:hypothetical protein